MRNRVILLAAALVLGLWAGALAQEKKDADLKVSIEADGEPLLAVLKKLCGQHGLNFVASEAALERAGKVALSLHDVPLDEALDSICEVHGLEARVRGRIVTVRVRTGEERRPAAPPSAAPAAPAKGRFLPEPEPAKRPDPAPEPAPTPPAIAEVGTRAPVVAPVPTAGGGAIIVGTVVEVTPELVKVKESVGEPREFHIPEARENDETARASRVSLAFKRLKKGDRIALEYRTENGRAVVTQLVGGGPLVK